MLLLCLMLHAPPALATESTGEGRAAHVDTRHRSKALLVRASTEADLWRREVRLLTRAWSQDDTPQRTATEATLRAHLQALLDDLSPTGVWRPAVEAGWPAQPHPALRDAAVNASLVDRGEHDRAVRERIRAWMTLDAAWDAEVRRLRASIARPEAGSNEPEASPGLSR
jgi:hypothetical protein